MKLSCPSCHAKYTVPDERLDGRRVRVRCKRCGESFAVDPTASSPSPFEPPPEPPAPTASSEGVDEPSARRPALTGERNDTSVLFSLASLAKPGPSAPSDPLAPDVTESSTMIDLRALCAPAATSADATTSGADAIAGLTGGGAFSPLFAPPVASPDAGPEPEPDRPRGIRRTSSFARGLAALAVLATLALAAFAGAARATRGTDAAPIPPGPPAIAAAPGPAIPPILAASASVALPARAPEPPAPSGSTFASTPPNPTVRGHVRAAEERPALAPSAASPSSPSSSSSGAKCCPGEGETACHMRLAVAAPCGDTPVVPREPPPPFDRAAAVRAMSIGVASCKRDDGPTGPGHVKVTFQPTGSPSAVDLDAPYGGTVVGACVARRFRAATIPPFAGGPLTLGKTFTVP